MCLIYLTAILFGLIAELRTQLGSVGRADHEVADEPHLGDDAELVARTPLPPPLPAPRFLPYCFSSRRLHLCRSLWLGLQQRLAEDREVQLFGAVLLGAQVATAAHQIRLAGIAQLLDLGEKFSASQSISSI